MTYQNSTPAWAKTTGTVPSPTKPRVQVVVADDHPIVREGLVANLREQRDMKVVAEANDGEEALAVIRQHLPDVALLDLRMPRVNGLEVLMAVKELKLQTKIIVMTTFASEEDIQRSMKTGARAYLLKDCSQKILVDAIRQVYRGEVYLLPQIAQKLVDRIQKPQLTPRELEVMKALASGKSNKEIGVQLFISEGTVKTHVGGLLQKLGAATRMSAVNEAVRRGFIQMA